MRSVKLFPRRRQRLLRNTFLPLFLLICVPVCAATNFAAKKAWQEVVSVEPLKNIPQNETLVYEVSWMGVPVGFGRLEVKGKETIEGVEAYHVVATAVTNDFLSKIYPVHDEVHSWIDTQTLQSLQFGKKVSEGRYRADEIVRYDAAVKKGFYESLLNGTKKEFPVAVPVHDVLSAFYWARRQTLTPGKSISTTVNNGEKDYGLEIDVLRRERKEMRGSGVLDVFLIEPKTRLEGILEKRGRVWVYLKNDAPRTPILIQFKTPFGPIVGALKTDHD